MKQAGRPRDETCTCNKYDSILRSMISTTKVGDPPVRIASDGFQKQGPTAARLDIACCNALCRPSGNARLAEIPRFGTPDSDKSSVGTLVRYRSLQMCGRRSLGRAILGTAG